MRYEKQEVTAYSPNVSSVRGLGTGTPQNDVGAPTSSLDLYGCGCWKKKTLMGDNIPTLLINRRLPARNLKSLLRSQLNIVPQTKYCTQLCIVGDLP